MARRASAILLLDRGWGCEKVSDALLLDVDTIRDRFKMYREGGVTALEGFDLAGGYRALNGEQLALLKVWVTATLPATTNVVGHHIETTCGVSYTRSGLVELMAALDVVWRKPELVPSHLDLAAQTASVDRHEKRSNGLEADEAIVYGDAVHPTHQTRPAGVWMPRGADIAVPAASDRHRMNIHGVIDLETAATRMKEVLSVDADSTIDLLTSIEAAYRTMRRIPVYLDDARYHHARAVQTWMKQPGRRIVPTYRPHLNSIERLLTLPSQKVASSCVATAPHHRCRDDAEPSMNSESEGRFSAYVEALCPAVGHADRTGPLRDYCVGLLMPGERKSVDPMAAVTSPARVSAQHQSLLHFVGQASWSDAAVLWSAGQTGHLPSRRIAFGRPSFRQPARRVSAVSS